VEPYHIGCATVQPVFWAIASAMRVTRNVSSPIQAWGPWASVEPIGTMMMSFCLSRASICFQVMFWR
jgi:hypothetical protein